jgi:CheY-like chemotaxis protein
MLSQILSLDFDVVGVAADGEEAIEEIGGADPDVVIVDYMMPGIDGIETARAIRTQRPEQPILLYTAFLDGDIEDRARQAGVFECVTKLDGPVALERAIRRIAGEQFF